MNVKQLQLLIDQTIKDVWVKNIFEDYQSSYLLKEDTLKNALYYHLRNQLQSILAKYNLRIFTEFHYKGVIADLAIVVLNGLDDHTGHLKDEVIDVLAIIEVKYKHGGSLAPFENDLEKVNNYITIKPIDH
ncbi:hypothetical protein [Alkalihalobacterium alkalinitrilicum]|uniref:hypothetical protein n=1 Tax=Alkalihalobacterium alkalinitrilicum TaxID=427920 RepID=UPI000995AF22|nr:hypothetical protein [Alkalihalobacterium alkalinitrilicum]